MSYAEADVSVRSAEQRGFERIVQNWPITSGDRIVTGVDARAEVSFGVATARLDANTDATVVELDRSRLQLSLEEGMVRIHVPEFRDAQPVIVRTRRGAVQLVRAGDYRIEVPADGTLTLVVRQGEARVDLGDPKFQQFAGEQANVASDGTLAIVRAPHSDNFDRWSEKRKRQFAGKNAARHVAQGLVGYEDLDVHGDWHWERDYGMVWGPDNLPAGWVPYRSGRWIQKSPWGWTWVDEAPWGFAPFHYGRWVFLRERWYWLPGPRKIAPVYAPALVHWIENSADRGRIGWAPLGPYAQFQPTYPASERYTQALNTFVRPSHTAAHPAAIQEQAVTWTNRASLPQRAESVRQRAGL